MKQAFERLTTLTTILNAPLKGWQRETLENGELVMGDWGKLMDGGGYKIINRKNSMEAGFFKKGCGITILKEN